MSESDDYDVIFLEIGCKGRLAAFDCLIAATAFRLARVRYPSAKIGFCLGGYDDDPRELYDIAETRDYIRQWAHAAGLADWREAATVRWQPPECLGILQLCGVFADDSPIFVNTPMGLRR